MDFWEFHAQEPLVLEEGLVVVGGERAQALLDEEELVELIFAGEHGVAVDEFSENATDCPHVDFLSVGRPNEQLGRTVPARGHIIGHFFLAAAFGLPREAEVANLEFSFVADQQVFGFYVPVQHVHRVHVGQSLEQLVQEQPDCFGFEAIWRFFEQFEQVVLNVFEDEVHYALLAERLFQFDDIGMLQHL